VSPQPSVAEVVDLLHGWYDPGTAEAWDAVGLVTGDPAASVRRVMFAVDPVQAVLDEAVDWGADLLVVHHPLLLQPVASVAATTPKGRAVHTLIRGGVALLVAHTNADIATDGVSAAMADALGLSDAHPLEAREAATHAGASNGRPSSGHGRIGRLAEPMSLGAFAQQVAAVLPHNASGIRIAGSLAARVEMVAVCGGSGDSLLERVRQLNADVYVTSDLRHHRAGEHLEHAGAPALVDVPHWAAEATWLPVVEQRLRSELAAKGTTVGTRVSTLVTDPWTAHLPMTSRSLP
jgi:dinuclear metal center YbgI/SA1388 family protein